MMRNPTHVFMLLPLVCSLLVGIGPVQAESESQQPVTYETYKSAIESFGVEPALASKIARDIVAEMTTESISHSLDENEAPLAGMPEDFLRQNPYGL